MTSITSVIIEGADGSGKTTLVKNLSALLTEKGHTVISIGEPNKLIKGLREVAKKAQVAKPDIKKITSLTNLNYDDLYQDSSPTSCATIALMLACMAEADDFLVSLSAQLSSNTRKSIVVLRDRSILSTIVYQAIVPKKLYLIKDIWQAYSSLVQNDRHLGCIMLDTDVETANKRHSKDCHYDAHIDMIIKSYRLIPNLMGMTREQFMAHAEQTGRPKDVANLLYSSLSDKHRDGFKRRIPQYYTIETNKNDEATTLALAYKKFTEWSGASS